MDTSEETEHGAQDGVVEFAAAIQMLGDTTFRAVSTCRENLGAERVRVSREASK